ncbi:hypothetical protein ACFWOB_37370 [Streptomyces sp. NPDC058420]|uniref:hypothetical protein n=1 Tax=Streptomyces sp. NPDC058420 TaxID=3346489 RepID=UPI00364BE061
MTHWKWNDWVAHWAGEEDEDLSLVFRQVRVQRTAKTQQHWARDPITRAFCDLGAYSLYEHHLAGGLRSADVPEMRLFPNMGGEHLMKLAPKVIPDAWLADSLNRQRYADTWAHHDSYISDLIAYMFRSAPTLRRVKKMTAAFAQAANDLSLGELVRAAAEAEIESTLSDPIIALQTFFQAVLPRQPKIQEAVRRIEREMINEWANLYAVVLSGYGLTLRPGITAHDVAELFDTVIEGVLLRARSSGSVPETTIGQDVLTASILLMLPAMCDVPPEELDRRRLRQPLEWPA